MRWLEYKTKLKDRQGERRVISTYLWFPRLLRNRKLGKEEWRWLERVSILQQIEPRRDWGFWAYRWYDVSWSDLDLFVAQQESSRIGKSEKTWFIVNWLDGNIVADADTRRECSDWIDSQLCPNNYSVEFNTNRRG